LDSAASFSSKAAAAPSDGCKAETQNTTTHTRRGGTPNHMERTFSWSFIQSVTSSGVVSCDADDTLRECMQRAMAVTVFRYESILASR
jgi:hypothetical protein